MCVCKLNLKHSNSIMPAASKRGADYAGGKLHTL